MERLIRGLMQCASIPEASECVRNWKTFDGHSFELRVPEDGTIVEYLQQWYAGNPDAPPDIALVREYFEKDDNVETTSRLDEIKGAQVYIRENYRSVASKVKQDQRNRDFDRLLHDAQMINRHGSKLKGYDQVMRGCDDAKTWLAEIGRAHV